MRRFILLIGLFILFFILLFFPSSALADGEIIVYSSVDYRIDDKGRAFITHNLTLENVYPTIQALNYSLELYNLAPEKVNAYEDGRQLDTDIQKESENTKITVYFDKPVLGRGAKRNFSISFESEGLTEKNGVVWEITIPKLSNPQNFADYNLIVEIPKSFGDLSYITPQPSRQTTGNHGYLLEFNKEAVTQNAVKAGFGEFQVFYFTLNYHLENPLSKTSSVQIALPPDTAFQKIYLNEINPRPQKIEFDADGNWIATYELKGRERMDILTTGNAQIFASPRQFMAPSDEDLKKYLQPQMYWEVTDPEIAYLASKYTTPKAIYDFVVNKLNYDYQRVRPNVTRLGAKESLKNPDSAICMEFTDLFVAIARAAKIPAREINGFAYTDNPQIKPLSLVADVLHSWPEYWDGSKKSWIAVDPTWENTTGGADFFNKLDLRHFTFVIHASDSQKPYAPGSYKLGPNPQKDVFVNFGTLPDNINFDNVSLQTKIIGKKGLLGQRLDVEITNINPTAIYNKEAVVYFDNHTVKSFKIDYLLPYNTYHFYHNIPFSLFGRNSPKVITVSFLNKTNTLQGNRQIVILSNLILIFILSFLIFIIFYIINQKFLPKRDTISKIYASIRSILYRFKILPPKKGN